MSARADPGYRVDYYLYVFRLGSLYDLLQAFFSTEHFVGWATRGHCQRRGVVFFVFGWVWIRTLIWTVVASQGSHDIQGRDSLLRILVNAISDIREGTSLLKSILILVKLGILVVNLYLVERVLPHSLSMHDEPPLRQTSDVLLVVVVVVVEHVFLPHYWKHGVRLPNDLTWRELSILANLKQPPIEEAAFPELSEIDAYGEGNVVFFDDIPWLHLMPGDQVQVVPVDRWRSCKSEEKLWVLGLLFLVRLRLLDVHIDDEVLADGTNGGLEGLLQLPVDLIVDHVEEDDGLVAHCDVTVAHELNEQLLYEIERFFVVRDLWHE